MTHTHDVIDNDEDFIIDPITRVISNQSGKTTLMQYDHNSERFTFALPRKIEYHDMDKCNKVHVYYINIGVDGDISPGKYRIPEKDIGIDPDDEETVLCSWLIEDYATQYPGTLSFMLRFCCEDENGDETYRWQTDVYKDIKILDGLNADQVTVDKYNNVLNEWYTQLMTAGGEGINVVEEYVENTAKPVIAAARDEGIKAIATSYNLGVNTINSHIETVSKPAIDEYVEGRVQDAILDLSINDAAIAALRSHVDEQDATLDGRISDISDTVESITPGSIGAVPLSGTIPNNPMTGNLTIQTSSYPSVILKAIDPDNPENNRKGRVFAQTNGSIILDARTDDNQNYRCLVLRPETWESQDEAISLQTNYHDEDGVEHWSSHKLYGEHNLPDMIKTADGGTMGFFAGTDDEYKNLPDTVDKDNLFAVITNDTTKDTILKAIDALQSPATYLHFVSVTIPYVQASLGAVKLFFEFTSRNNYKMCEELVPYFGMLIWNEGKRHYRGVHITQNGFEKPITDLSLRFVDNKWYMSTNLPENGIDGRIDRLTVNDGDYQIMTLPR